MLPPLGSLFLYEWDLSTSPFNVQREGSRSLSFTNSPTSTINSRQIPPKSPVPYFSRIPDLYFQHSLVGWWHRSPISTSKLNISKNELVGISSCQWSSNPGHPFSPISKPRSPEPLEALFPQASHHFLPSTLTGVVFIQVCSLLGYIWYTRCLFPA